MAVPPTTLKSIDPLSLLLQSILVTEAEDVNASGSVIVNVSVNVSGSGQASMSSNGGGNLEGMGRQIGALVQQHLQQEMRPGGILNSQGNRGR